MLHRMLLVTAACGLGLACLACGSAGRGSGAGPVVPDPGQSRDAEIAARAAKFVDAFSNYSAALAPGGLVAFVSTRDGLPQLYVGSLAEPSAPPRRLPTPAERILRPQLLPDGKTLVFISDVGSDQQFHLFRIGIGGTGLVDLTPAGDLHRSAPQIARRAGTLVYTAHALDNQATRVFAHTVDAPPREVYRDPRSGYVADVTADGGRALYVDAVSDTEQTAFALDIATGAVTRLFPPEGQLCSIGGAVAFTADGERAILGCAARGRALRLVEVDSRTGAEQAHYDETAVPTADLGGIAVSPRGDLVVAELDAGDHSELRLFDPGDLRPLPAPEIPLAAISLGAFDADGDRLALAVGRPDAPPEIAALDLARDAARGAPGSSRIELLRREDRPGLGTPPRASIEQLAAFDGRTIRINVYLPDGATGRLPTLVLIHGGPSGSAKIAWSSTIGFWTAMGFAVVAPNIRGSTGFGIEFENADNREHRIDAVRDVESVNRWARSQPWCDGDRLVIGGISYGGYMTLLALTRQPALWRAGIDGSGMSNLVTMEQLEDQQVRMYDDTEFGALGKDDALLVEWSPITAVDRIVAPVFVYQGVRDPVTPQHEADQIVAALRRRGVPVEYMLIANEGHGVTRRENLIAYLARSYRFVTEHMAGAR